MYCTLQYITVFNVNNFTVLYIIYSTVVPDILHGTCKEHISQSRQWNVVYSNHVKKEAMSKPYPNPHYGDFWENKYLVNVDPSWI